MSDRKVEKESLVDGAHSDKGSEGFSWVTENGPMGTLELLKSNFPAAATVSLVSVSLSIALGIASGSTPAAGLATAIYGGLTFGFIGSSPYNIVGPAGALSGMLNSYAFLWTADILPWVSIFSSIVVALVWVFKLHSYMLYMPNSVFEGFTVAVAVIIGFGQMNFALGLVPAVRHPEFVLNVAESFKIIGDAKPESYSLFIPLFLALYFLMKSKYSYIPWSVLLPGLTIIVGYTQRESESWMIPTLKTKYGMLEPTLFQLPKVDVLKNSDIGGVIGAAAAVAFVAVLETLISAKIAQNKDKAQQGPPPRKSNPRPFDEDVETRALIVAHALCGVAGAMPPTGVFVRTNLNLDLGANHRFSQWLNAVFVLIISAVGMPVFSYIPQASIASILVVASVRMFPNHLLGRLWGEDRTNFGIMVLTAVVAIGEDPVMGLCLGTFLALLLRAKEMNESIDSDGSKKLPNPSIKAGKYDGVDVFTFTGSVCYLNAENMSIKGKLLLKDGTSAKTGLILDMANVTELDLDGADWVGNFCNVALPKPGDGAEGSPRQACVVVGASADVQATLKKGENAAGVKYFGEGSIGLHFADSLAAAVTTLNHHA